MTSRRTRSASFAVRVLSAVSAVLAVLLAGGTMTAGAASASGSQRASVTEAAQVAPIPEVRGNSLIDARTGRVMRLLGVDASGTEDACTEDKGFGWGPLDAAEASAIASWHTDAVRVPLNEDCWLGINGAPGRYSGEVYQQRMKAWVADLNAAGLVAIVDLHYSAPGRHEASQEWPMPDANHSVTFWTQVASSFESDPSVVFDLFNEPYMGKSQPTGADWACWRNGCRQPQQLCRSGSGTNAVRTQLCTPVVYRVAGVQQLLDAVRATGATQPVMIGGLNWATDPCGVNDRNGNGGSCTWLRYEPSDPDHQLIASFHNYNWTSCHTLSCWDSSVAPVARSVPVVTGELGDKQCSGGFMSRYMTWADAHGISYLGWSWQPTDALNANCAARNTQLLSNWSGSPSKSAPDGATLENHLAGLWATSRRL